MVEILVTPEQAEAIRSAKDLVLLRAPDGRLVGQVNAVHIDEEDLKIIAQINKRRNEPTQWYTTEEVLAHLRSLGPE